MRSDKLLPGSQIRIVLLSDLHNTFFGESQEELIAKVKGEKPDLILLTGDMCESPDAMEGVTALLEGIVPLAPVYAVAGNHEYRSGRIGDIWAVYDTYGVAVLQSQWEYCQVGGNQILVGGFDDMAAPFRGQGPDSERMAQAFAGVEGNGRFSVLLAHFPENDEIYAGYGFDLTVSGHTHGGQARIPFVCNGLYAHGQGWFPRRAGGLYQNTRPDGGAMAHLVSRGLSLHSRLPRVYNPPEINVITVLGPAD